MIQSMPSSIPHTPGIYLFKQEKSILYVGKAGDLRKRLSSYWRANAGKKTRQLLQESTNLEWQELSSEIEALIKEAELIKRHRPKFNVLMRDDKSYFYVGITKEEYPRIFFAHQTQLKNSKFQIPNSRSIGPFTSGASLKATLKFLRRIFPYCTCRPHSGTCLNAQIGRCMEFCCNKKRFGTRTPTMREEYHANIKNIVEILGGKKKYLLRRLAQELKAASRREQFEHAAKLRDQMQGLENIFRHRAVLTLPRIVLNRRSVWKTIERTIQDVLGMETPILRVEGYDISNISGSAATGSMVVFVDGKAVKSEYRKFRIKTVRQISDVAMHQEVMRRRLAHAEWRYPDLMIIDGGKPQLNAVLSVLRESRMNEKIIVVGLAKREEELYIPGRDTTIRLDSLPERAAFFFQNVRDESHRFAKKYHHLLRLKELK